MVCVIAAGSAWAEPAVISSPDGALELSFGIQETGPAYRLSRGGEPVIVDSRLGLEIEGADPGAAFRMLGHETKDHDETWKPVWGERSEIRDRYRELAVRLQGAGDPGLRIDIVFRLYDEGVAIRYVIPEQNGLEKVTIPRERTEFRFPADHAAWATYTAQGLYEQVSLSLLKGGCERPLVLEAAPNLKIALAEAALVDFPRMKFGPLPGVPHSLVSRLDGPAEGTLPLATPWRVAMVADSPGRLLENNHLLLNLNDPCAIGDTSWIKPGKVIREGTLTTDGGKRCVDFAVKRGLQYIEFDAGWYGPENDDASDARTVSVDPARHNGPLDLHEVIRYAGERGIGVILYVNRRELERRLDELLPLYQEWGIKGIKFGFVNVGSQKWTSWLHEAVRKCADYRMLVDIHDEYRPTGYSRTYPNLLTVEGVRGDEESPPNPQTLATAFTRLLAGPADNTVCYYDGRVSRNASRAYQLAKPVCLFSPWQFLFWYDRPTGPDYGNDPELEFYNAMPATWDETRVLNGAIGEYALIARRSGGDWFVGFMNSGVPRSLRVPLDFLTDGARYDASVYMDDLSERSKGKVWIDRAVVKSGGHLDLSAGPQGGAAVWIRKQP